MKINSIYRLGLLSLAGAALASCSFLDTEPAVIPNEGYYDSEKKILYGLAGVYGVMSTEELYGHYYSLQIANADDLCYFNNYNNGEIRVDRYNHNAGTEVVYGAWSRLYEGIKNANELMRSIEGSKFDPRGHAYNEARFLRAYYHFLLAQAWGGVPLRTEATTSPNPTDVQLAATPQEQVLKWCADEIEAVVPSLDESVGPPSRVNRDIAQGILARIYLFIAGETVKPVDGLDKQEAYRLAARHAGAVISTGRYSLNPDYKQVFINMISDKYDTRHYESMWEVEFQGDRTSGKQWTNGRIGDLIGMRSQASSNNYSDWACNYSYGFYNGSWRLWQLYWTTDRTSDEASNSKSITDARQDWNLPGYNFRGMNNQKIVYTKNGTSVTRYLTQPQSLHKTPWQYNNTFAIPELEGVDASVTDAFDPADRIYDPTVMAAIRNSGKWRRETIYEQQMNAKRLYTGINFPLLRYSDVLLMYAEAVNEYAGAPDGLAKENIRLVRSRAGVKTDEAQMSGQREFRNLVRNERGRELAFEGLRKWDLIRWGIFVEQMRLAGTDVPTENKYKNATITSYASSNYSNVVARHVYLPIPTKELAVNHALKQNPLW